MPVAVLLAALLGAAEPPPGAAGPEPSPAAEHARAIPPEVVATAEEPRLKLLGVQLAVGAPEGAGVSAFVRPIPWLRIDGGGSWNYLSFGINGGITVMPWSGRITPTFRFGAGQFFDSDVRSELAGSFPDAFDPALRRFGYHFYTAQLGLELGNENGAQFFVRGGLAWLRSSLESTNFRNGDTTVTADGNDISATTPSVQLGLLLHLW